MVVSLEDIDAKFWGDRLEVNTELLVQRLGDDEYVLAWLKRLWMRPRSLLAKHLGIEPALSPADTREALYERRDELLPMMLVEATAAGKRRYAISEVASAKLLCRPALAA